MASFKLPKNDTLELFDIEFDDENAVVYAGQELTGRVVVKFSELMTLRGIRLRLLGRSRTTWPDDRLAGQQHSNEHVMCQAEEVYFDTTMTLYGFSAYDPEASRKSNKRRAALHEGVYEFPFQYQIDIDCPNTFEGEHGYVRYVCCATVATPWKHNRVAKRAFTVIQPCDLNFCTPSDHDGPVSEPVDNESSVVPRTGCCLTANRDEIKLLVKLPKSGFVCGEKVPIWANVSNNSGQRIKKIKATLIQRTKYKSKFRGNLIRERVSYRTVAQVCTSEELGPRWALIWDQASIRIPPVVPTSDGACSLVQVDYGLIYEAAPISLALPIHIGTLPLKSAAKALRTAYKTDLSHMNPSRYPKNLLPLHPNWTKYLSIVPPPFYCNDEGVGPVPIRERADNEYVPGQLVYEPRYPYYDWPPIELLIPDDESVSLSILQ